MQVSSVTEHVGAQDAEAKTADFDDDGGGLALNALSRAMLSGKIRLVGGTLGIPALNEAAQPAMSMPMGGPTAFLNMLPTQSLVPWLPIHWNSQWCLLLKKHVSDPATGGGVFSTYGRVKHIHVDKHSPVTCTDLIASKLHLVLNKICNKRWFAGRSISAIFLEDALFNISSVQRESCEVKLKFKPKRRGLQCCYNS
ncbi:hypothetical protein HAX54_052615 [Datura stramonium]|uniref:Uncharacterized protein n=1 Tax=Datura stramonium TaxID=4076 RepID=A0ABS8T1G6_DATST|nr:hypothetical protein [Datura stramonium]